MSQLATWVLERARRFGERPLLHGNGACVRETWTGPELESAVRSFAAGLLELGVAPGEKIGLVADNCDLWLVADLACLLIGAPDVPRAGDAPPAEVAFVLEHSECRVLIVEDEAQRERLRGHLDFDALRALIVLRPDPSSDPESRDGALSFEEVSARGHAAGYQALEQRAATIDEGHLASIVYTSGTTGNPKGVMLTHGNFLHNVRTLPEIVDFSARDEYLSFLPSWHAFERTVEYCGLSAGMGIHYSSKATLKRDLLRVRPTVVAGVPRLWESIVSGVLAKTTRLKAPLKQLVAAALWSSARHQAARRELRGLELDDRHRRLAPGASRKLLLTSLSLLHLTGHVLAGALIYNKIRDAVGGRVRFLVSGGGALPRHVDEFLSRTPVLLINGYGLTETAPVVSVRRLDRNVLESSGELLPETRWRVMDEAGDRELPQGEKGVLWIQGPQVMQGYFKNETATDIVLRDDWFCSGDLAVLSDHGDVVICGRAKDTLVLRGGENVEPEIIEAKILESPYVRDVLLVGHGQKHLGALVLPEPEALSSHFSELAPDAAPSAAADHPQVGKFLHRELAERLSPDRGFRVFERVPRLAVFGEAFSPEGKTLTPTLKKKRQVIEELYAEDIQRMFEEGGSEVFRAACDPTSSS